MNTDGLFITRKRKKWKFAHFDQWPNCFGGGRQNWPAYFGDDAPLIVEVGAGTADLSIGMAVARPHDHFVAVDIKSDRLYTGAKYALQQQLGNIAFLRAYINHLAELFLPASVKELWITFPDPFERKKQAKHRLTHAQFLQTYKKLLTPDGVVHFKTDNHELFLWSLEQFVREGWHVEALSFDLHQSDLPDAYKITTAYERRFMAQDIPINFATCRPGRAQ